MRDVWLFRGVGAMLVVAAGYMLYLGQIEHACMLAALTAVSLAAARQALGEEEESS
jgi:hypothetical protein